MVERGAVAGLGFGVVILECGVKMDLSALRPCSLRGTLWRSLNPHSCCSLPSARDVSLLPLPCADGKRGAQSSSPAGKRQSWC